MGQGSQGGEVLVALGPAGFWDTAEARAATL
jgi:hypothetical protein